MSDASAMDLMPATGRHVLEMMTWFPDERSCTTWGGPEFRFPFTEASFREDSRCEELPSFALLGVDGALLGFGLYYDRAGRCHLARLVISPQHRRRGLGAVIVRELSRRGCRELGLSICSLFVLADNAPACRLYRRLGFEPAPFPEETPPWEGCLYMIVSAHALMPEAVLRRGSGSCGG